MFEYLNIPKIETKESFSDMNFVFWQDILSLHQSAFIRNLANKHKVVLVTEKDIDKQRINEGWSIPNFGRTKIIISPKKNQIQHLLDENKRAIHIFSGIIASSLAHFAFKLAIRRRFKVGIMTEAGINIGIHGYLSRLKSIYFGLRYSQKIDFLLAMGDIGFNWYSKNYIPQEKIFPFFYAVEEPETDRQRTTTNQLNGSYKLIVIAQCIKRKGLDVLINTLAKLIKLNWQLIIIGDGELKQELKNKTKLNKLENKILFLGVMQNKDAMEYLKESDLLILPSRFDGWGAVVNEALIRGIPVIASDNCGASCLLDGKLRGAIFNLRNNELTSILNSWINNGKLSQTHSLKISSWARLISGEKAANYFIEIVQSVYNKMERPKAPWVE